MSDSRPPSVDFETIRVVGAAILDGRHLLAAQRAESASNGLRWELPGGKIEPGESPQDALRRELDEELGVEVEVGGLLGHGHATGEFFEISLVVYRTRIVGGQPTAREHRQLRWVSAEELADLDWTTADRPLLPTLCQLLETGQKQS